LTSTQYVTVPFFSAPFIFLFSFFLATLLRESGCIDNLQCSSISWIVVLLILTLITHTRVRAHTHTRLTAFFQDNLGKLAPER